MKSTAKRVITACIEVPLLVILVFALPQLNYLGFSLFILITAVLGARELENMFRISETNSSSALPYWAGGLLIICEYLCNVTGISTMATIYVFTFLVFLSLVLEMLQGSQNNFKTSITRFGVSVLLLAYPYFYSTFFIKLTTLPNCQILLFAFYMFVFSSATAAYLFGSLFGKNNRGVVKVSPNKSVAGFIAALAIPAIEGILLAVFIEGYHMAWYEGLLLGFFTSFAGICGDLIESTFKRAAGIKDSGTIIPGRGGMMDSIDSLVTAAPVFYFIIKLAEYI